MAGAILSADILHEHTVSVIAGPCCVCTATHSFLLNLDKYVAWQAGEHIQNAFPELSVADREILISGTCDACFDKLFPPSEK